MEVPSSYQARRLEVYPPANRETEQCGKIEPGDPLRGGSGVRQGRQRNREVSTFDVEIQHKKSVLSRLISPASYESDTSLLQAQLPASRMILQLPLPRRHHFQTLCTSGSLKRCRGLHLVKYLTV